MDFLFGGSALNAGTKGVALVLPQMYGLVILVAVVSAFLLIWLGVKVRVLNSLISHLPDITVVMNINIDMETLILLSIYFLGWKSA